MAVGSVPAFPVSVVAQDREGVGRPKSCGLQLQQVQHPAPARPASREGRVERVGETPGEPEVVSPPQQPQLPRRVGQVW
jgi:hypothetical protein